MDWSLKTRWGRLPAGKWAIAGLVLLGIVGVLALTILSYTAVELARFERAEARRPAIVYAAGQWLGPGVNVRAVDLAGTLERLRYVETLTRPVTPGQFQRRKDGWEIVLRGTLENGRREPQRVRLDVRDERITAVLLGNRPVAGVSADPEILTSIDERPGEESRPVRLGEVPVTLLSAILATEDH